MTISEKCFRTADVWLDISKDFAVLQGMILAGKDHKDMENVFGDIGLVASYGYSKGLVSQEEVDVAKYHRDKIKESLERTKSEAFKTAESAITWAGRTFADKIVACECQK